MLQEGRNRRCGARWRSGTARKRVEAAQEAQCVRLPHQCIPDGGGIAECSFGAVRRTGRRQQSFGCRRNRVQGGCFRSFAVCGRVEACFRYGQGVPRTCRGGDVRIPQLPGGGTVRKSDCVSREPGFGGSLAGGAQETCRALPTLQRARTRGEEFDDAAFAGSDKQDRFASRCACSRNRGKRYRQRDGCFADPQQVGAAQ